MADGAGRRSGPEHGKGVGRTHAGQYSSFIPREYAGKSTQADQPAQAQAARSVLQYRGGAHVGAQHQFEGQYDRGRQDFRAVPHAHLRRDSAAIPPPVAVRQSPGPALASDDVGARASGAMTDAYHQQRRGVPAAGVGGQYAPAAKGSGQPFPSWHPSVEHSPGGLPVRSRGYPRKPQATSIAPAPVSVGRGEGPPFALPDGAGGAAVLQSGHPPDVQRASTFQGFHPEAAGTSGGRNPHASVVGPVSAVPQHVSMNTRPGMTPVSQERAPQGSISGMRFDAAVQPTRSYGGAPETKAVAAHPGLFAAAKEVKPGVAHASNFGRHGERRSGDGSGMRPPREAGSKASTDDFSERSFGSLEEAQSGARLKFEDADVHKTGWLDPREFLECMRQLGLRLAYREALGLFGSVDADQDGRIVLMEFVNLVCDLWKENIL